MTSRTRSLILIALIPVALIGAVLWWLGGQVPQCTTSILNTLESPDASNAVVTIARDCGTAGFNTQAVMIPAGGTLEDNGVGFLALEGAHDLAARWDGFGNLEVTIPTDAVVAQQLDEAAGIAIIYN